MLEINDIIYLILAFSFFTFVIIIITNMMIKSRQKKNAKTLNELTSVITDIKATVVLINEKQQANQIMLSDINEALQKLVNVEKEPAVVVEIAEEPIIKQEIEEVVEQSTSRTVELASKIADYAKQIEELNDITDVQVRDLKKQLLIFELQEIKREIASIES